MRSRMAATILACGTVLAVPVGAGADDRELSLQMLAGVNEVRVQHGLAAFGDSASLRRSARRYAGWMLRAGYFGHLRRIHASSRFSLLGETLAWHSGLRPRVSQTVRRWMHSPPHRALILHPGFRWLGAGMARGRLAARRATAWVLHLGGPLSATGATAPTVSVVADQLPSEASTLSALPEIPATTSAAGASVASAAP